MHRVSLSRWNPAEPGVAAVITDHEVPLADFRVALSSLAEETAVVLVDDAELLTGSEIDSELVGLAGGSHGDRCPDRRR